MLIIFSSLRATHSPGHCSLVSASTVFLKLLLSKLLTLFLVLVENFLFFSYFNCQEHLDWYSPLALETPTLLDSFPTSSSRLLRPLCQFLFFRLFLKVTVPQCLIQCLLFSLYIPFPGPDWGFWDHQKRSPLHCPMICNSKVNIYFGGLAWWHSG